MQRLITSFTDSIITGNYFFLSNFYPCPVEYEGTLYPTSEHAYQAGKTLDEKERLAIQACKTPGQAKRIGQKVTLRRNWDQWKDTVMFVILLEKFTQCDMRQKLLSTGHAKLIEGNDWGDTYWGMVKDENGQWKGENKLGEMLMGIRAALREQK